MQKVFRLPIFLWFKIFALITTLQEHGKLKKKEFLHWCIWKILFIDTEQFSKMQISLQVFFKDSVDWFGTTDLKNGFLWSCFSNILLIHFWIATNLKTGLSKTRNSYIHTYIHTYIHMYVRTYCEWGGGRIKDFSKGGGTQEGEG